MALLIFYLALSIGVSFLCSVLEAVLLSLTPSFVETMKRERPGAGRVLEQVRDNLDNSIACILILNTFAHTMGAAGVGSQAVQQFGAKWESLIAVMLTLVILYFSEIIPKTLGATYWRILALPAARIIKWLVRLVYPLVWLSAYVTRLFSNKKHNGISREEILAFAALGYKGGVLGRQETQLLENILALRQISTEQILTPRTVVHALPEQSSVSAALAEPLTERFSRIPVFRDSVDQITGLVTNRQLFELEREGHSEQRLSEIARPVFTVSQSLPVLLLLDLFISRKEHLFVVEDIYGQVAGIVTLEDAIETLLGREIVDETDVAEDMQKLARRRFRERLRRKRNLVADPDADKE